MAIARALRRRRARSRNVADRVPVLAPGESVGFDASLDATVEVIEESRAVVERWRSSAGPVDIRSIQWFVPWFHNPHGGGVATVLRFARYFAEHGAENRFHIYDRDEPPPVPLPGLVTTRDKKGSDPFLSRLQGG